MQHHVVPSWPLDNINEILLKDACVLTTADSFAESRVISKAAGSWSIETILKIVNVNEEENRASTEPCVTPLKIRVKREYTPLTVTSCFLYRRNGSIHDKSLPSIPNSWSFRIRISWATLSKALVKSRKTTSCSWPLTIEASRMLSITVSKWLRRWV